MSGSTRVLCLAALLLWSGCSFAQEFPNRPIQFIVPFPAGGPADVIGRVLADQMSALLGQPVLIENRPAGSRRTISRILSTRLVSPQAASAITVPSSNGWKPR